MTVLDGLEPRSAILRLHRREQVSDSLKLVSVLGAFLAVEVRYRHRCVSYASHAQLISVCRVETASLVTRMIDIELDYSDWVLAFRYKCAYIRALGAAGSIANRRFPEI